MTDVHGHPHIDARVLDGARLTASKIDANPSLTAIARENIERYCEHQRWLPRHQTEWLEILELPWPEVRAILLQPGDEGQRLRSSHPFIGLLTEDERYAIHTRHPPPGAAPDWKPPRPWTREELAQLLDYPLTPAPLAYEPRTFAVRLAYHDSGWRVDATSARNAVAAVKPSVPGAWPHPPGELILWVDDEYRRRFGADALGPAWTRLSASQSARERA